MNWRKLLDEWKYIILILAVVLIAGVTTILVLQGQLPPDEARFTEDEVIAFVRYELINLKLISPTAAISSEAEYTEEGKWTGVSDSRCYDNRASDNSTECRITWYYYENRMGMGIISIEKDQ